MSKYASLLFAPEEYYEIGRMRFPVYHDLSPGEVDAIDKINRLQSKNAFKSVKLAQRIAKDKNITAKEAIELLKRAGEDEVEDIMFTYGEEIQALQDADMTPVSQQIAFVTVFMQHRGELKLGGDWKPAPDWSEDDTKRTPAKVLNQIFELILWERDGWPTEDGEGNDEPTPTEKPPQKKS